MKLRVLTVGLLTCLTLGLSFNEASAEPELSTPCEVDKPYENPTFQQVNCLLTNAAINADIPPELSKLSQHKKMAGNNLMRMESQSSLRMAESGSCKLRIKQTMIKRN